MEEWGRKKEEGDARVRLGTVVGKVAELGAWRAGRRAARARAWVGAWQKDARRKRGWTGSRARDGRRYEGMETAGEEWAHTASRFADWTWARALRVANCPQVERSRRPDATQRNRALVLPQNAGFADLVGARAARCELPASGAQSAARCDAGGMSGPLVLGLMCYCGVPIWGTAGDPGTPRVLQCLVFAGGHSPGLARLASASAWGFPKELSNSLFLVPNRSIVEPITGQYYGENGEN
ncbi:hypothetical protein B0H16DRAFT_1466542 [Mycena metata]|uniref:Uncharacterized protein n=1 Tax=Mycena metata TaxID=1033252 RepID=A0AAD7I784_9AGAR|nr:hypothetical protein B0H16DRAFT_1466542 [Mycena metata]